MISQTNLKAPYLVLAMLWLLPWSIQGQTCVPASSGLVSCWRAEGSALDSAGGNNGSLVGNVTYVPGKVGQAFSFAGGNNHVNIPSSSSINLSGNMPMTIETWVYRTGSATTMHILGKRNGCYVGEIQYQLAFDPTGGLSFIGNGGNFWVNTYRQLPMNTWQHLAVTYDGTNAVIFIDGQPVASGSGSLGPALAAPLKIGDAGSCGADYSAAFVGLIDEVSIYNRALSTNEVQAIYTAGSTGKCPPPPLTCVSAAPGLVSWWRGESSGSDFIGNNPATPLNDLGFATGKVGQAFDFNSSNSSMVIPASPTLHVGAGSGFSIETWIKPTTIDLQRPIVEWNSVTGGNPYPYGVHLWISVPVGYGGGPGCLYANVVDTDGAFHPFTSAGGLITTNTYQHVALTYDRASGQANLYLDGNVVASQNLGIFTPQTSYNLYLGNRPDAGPGAGSWAGQMDELSIYDRALSAAEIQAIYAAASAGKCPLSPPLAKATISPLAQFPGLTNLMVISPNNSNATVVLDGSLSTDAENHPLQYTWLEGTNVIATSVTVTKILGVGTHTITLVASDGTDMATDTVALEVITPVRAVGILTTVVDAANLLPKLEKALLVSLKASDHAFEKSKSRQGVKRISAFKDKIRKRIAPLDPALADELIHGAQAIIDALIVP